MLAFRSRAARISGALAATALTTLVMVPATSATAVTGPEPAADTHPYAVRLQLGGEVDSRACTGTLVDRFWVLTATSCFAPVPGSEVAAGKPALKTTAILGNGQAVEVTEIAPRSDRDAALVRLATPVTDIRTARLATSAAASGADLTASGFGRTKTEWVPGKLHTGAFSVTATDATSLTVTGKGADALCKGDTGGPMLNAAGELVGVNSRSWQGDAWARPPRRPVREPSPRASTASPTGYGRPASPPLRSATPTATSACSSVGARPTTAPQPSRPTVTRSTPTSCGSSSRSPVAATRSATPTTTDASWCRGAPRSRARP